MKVDIERLKALIEAALFMASDNMSIEHLSKLLRQEPQTIRSAIDELKIKYNNREHGIYILETETGYQLRVKPEYSPLVSHLTPHKDLTRGLLRVLSLVAYKQPITQSEIVKVIGNRAYEYVKRLEEKGFIKTVKHGRTKALIATKAFVE